MTELTYLGHHSSVPMMAVTLLGVVALGVPLKKGLVAPHQIAAAMSAKDRALHFELRHAAAAARC